MHTINYESEITNIEVLHASTKQQRKLTFTCTSDWLDNDVTITKFILIIKYKNFGLFLWVIQFAILYSKISGQKRNES